LAAARGCYIGIGMKKSDIAKRMARRAHLSQAEAADRLDGVVHQILASLRKGEEAPLPGLGKFLTKADGSVIFQKDEDGKRV
jgi:nucleoid DNA-binding protein